MNNTSQITVKISGITCGACVKLIKKKISRIAGVTGVDVTGNGETKIMSEKELKISDVATALSGTPYAVVVEGE